MSGSPIAIRPLLTLDHSSSTPLYRQICQNLREAITDGILPSGTRLPSSRALADDLGVSRNTVVNAFDQLRSEGYVESRVGAGTFVSSDLPEQHTQVRHPPDRVRRSLQLTDTSSRSPSLSAETQTILERPLSVLKEPGSQMAFRPGIPALDAFPIETWTTLLSRRWRSLPPGELVYGDPAGYPPLRQAVAEYLRTARGVRCETEQVLIVSGVQQALTLAARTLLEKGATAYVEDPGYPRMRGAFAAAGADPQPVPVDKNGLDLSSIESQTVGEQRSRDDKSPPDPASQGDTSQMVGVTPSHQYPLGVTMNLPRRLDLLEWAARTDTWIFEDDYDGQYRYSGHPLAALQGLDNAGRVLYAGTFSKVLFPALRLGYLVVPPDLVDAFTQMRTLSDRCPSQVQQMVLTDFIKEGYFKRHIRKMRTLYASRQHALLEAIDERLSEFIDVESHNAGLHLVGWLPENTNDEAVSARLEEDGIVAPPLSFYCERPFNRDGLLLGYGGVTKEEIRESVNQMAEVIEDFCG